MKTILATIVGGTLAVGLLQNLKAQNMLQNGSFEAGGNYNIPTSWTSVGTGGTVPGGPTVAGGFTWNVDFAKDGAAVGGVNAPQGSWSSSFMYQDVAIASVGTTYNLTFYIGMHRPWIDTGTVFVEYLDILGESIDGTKAVYTATMADYMERNWTPSNPVTEFSDLKSLDLGSAPVNAAFIRVGITYEDKGVDVWDLTKVDAMGLRMVAVPEPSTLLLSAVVGLGLTLRRRRW